MSATNRGAVRNPRDFYATPELAFAPLLSYLPTAGVCFWEPACGDGRIVRWLRDSGRVADGADIEPQDSGFRKRDFLKDQTRRDFIITNPPFSMGLEFASHATACANEVLLLLRINFLGSVVRREWLRQHEPAAIFVITPRPSFTGGGSDACEYAWFYWGSRFRGVHHP